ncbi:aconitase X [Rhodococcus sp. ZPP]|uniref:aconitase X n=1 Tax=Rhodococcus sp. ZPP TaxID=2749906 RepID=UPI001FCDD21B|nr:aconitase X [Rhodococcus sp. ZPP]
MDEYTTAERATTMRLTDHERAILGGAQGDVMAKVLRTVVRYGEIFGADRLAELDGPIHVVTSMGMTGLDTVFDLLDQMIDAGLTTTEPFTVDPRPFDFEAVSYTESEKRDLLALYAHQDRYEDQLRKLGIKNDQAYSCTAYLPEVGNTPGEGDILAWAESSAVVYANSVLAARTNRNSGLIELMCGIAGRTPEFGLLRDDGRRATWLVEVKTSELPPATVLGSAVGRAVVGDVPFVVGLDALLGSDLDDDATRDYLKDFGAATASNGAVGLFHVENLTPEAQRHGRGLLTDDHRRIVIDDRTIADLIAGYPILWDDETADAETALIGCPHLSYSQLRTVTDWILTALRTAGRRTVAIRTVLSAAPAVVAEFKQGHRELYEPALAAGITIASMCPALHMNTPATSSRPVITNSNKLRTYTTSRFFTDNDVLERIVEGNRSARTEQIR